MDRLVLNEEIHEVVFKDLIPNARKFIWVATADLKDLHLQRTAKKFDTFLSLFAELVADETDWLMECARE